MLCELLECLISLFGHYNEEGIKNDDEGTFDEDVQPALALGLMSLNVQITASAKEFEPPVVELSRTF